MGLGLDFPAPKQAFELRETVYLRNVKMVYVQGLRCRTQLSIYILHQSLVISCAVPGLAMYPAVYEVPIQLGCLAGGNECVFLCEVSNFASYCYADYLGYPT